MRITLELNFVHQKQRFILLPSEVSWFQWTARTHKSNFISRILFDLKDGGRVWQLVRDLIVVILHTSVIYLLLIISDCCKSFCSNCSNESVTLKPDNPRCSTWYNIWYILKMERKGPGIRRSMSFSHGSVISHRIFIINIWNELTIWNVRTVSCPSCFI